MINHRSFFENNQAIYDTDALAGFANSGITDGNIQDAINRFIVSCKARGNWTPITGLYILAGSTLSTQATNWKSPGTYNLSGFAGITHSAAGIQGNGTTNVVDTGIQVSTSAFSTSNGHLCFYTSTNTYSATQVADMGLFNGVDSVELGVYGSSPYSRAYSNIITSSAIASNNVSGPPAGVWYAQRTSLFDLDIWKGTTNVSTTGTTTAGIKSNLTGTIKLTARTDNAGTVSRRSSKVYGFFSVGGNQNNVSGYQSDILDLMAAFGR